MKLSLFSLAACFLLIGASEVFACTCMHLGRYQKPDQEIIDKKRESANAVFSGEVIKIVETKASKGSANISLKVHIKVFKVWKGIATENVLVSTAKASSFCGYPFKLKERYLIYAYRYEKGDLSTSLCERTTMLDNAEEDIKFLGDAEKTFADKKKEKR